jgi:hypothetical protein
MLLLTHQHRSTDFNVILQSLCDNVTAYAQLDIEMFDLVPVTGGTYLFSLEKVY